MSERNDLLEKAFLDGEMQVGNLNLRPFSLGTLNLARQMKLTLFTGPLEGQSAVAPVPADGQASPLPMALSEDEVQWQVSAFAWMQSAPLKEVIAAVRKGTWREEVDLFQFGLEAALLPRLMSEIERISKLAEVAAVGVKDKPGSGEAEKGQPGNS